MLKVAFNVGDDGVTLEIGFLVANGFEEGLGSYEGTEALFAAR
jgi:hypothetical protein